MNEKPDASYRILLKKLGLLFVAALAIRVIIAFGFSFDGLYGQDPFAYYRYAIELRAALLDFQPPPPFFWPLGYPLLVVLSSLAIGIRPLAGQSVSLIAGSLIAPLVYLLVVEIRPRATAGGLAAGLLAATSAQLTLSSASIMSDAAGLAWACISALALLRYHRNLSRRWLVLAAFALGWAVLTRWVYALLVFPWALSALLAWRRARLSWQSMTSAAAVAVFVGGFVLGSQFLFSAGEEGLAHTGDLQVVGWNPANALKSTVTNSDGAFNYERPIGLFYALPAAHPAFVFPLLTPFLLLGIWCLVRRPRELTERPERTLVLGWAAIAYIFLAGIAWQNSRFSLAFYPTLLILVGLGFQAAWDWRGPSKTYERLAILYGHYAKWVLVIWFALGLLGSLAWTVRDLRRFTDQNNAQIAAARWVEGQLPPKATLITFGVTLTIENRTAVSARDIYLLEESGLSELTATPEPLFLFLDLDNVLAQWSGLSPERNYRWLSEHTNLVEVDRHPPYTLFKVESRAGAATSAIPLTAVWLHDE